MDMVNVAISRSSLQMKCQRADKTRRGIYLDALYNAGMLWKRNMYTMEMVASRKDNNNNNNNNNNNSEVLLGSIIYRPDAPKMNI